MQANPVEIPVDSSAKVVHQHIVEIVSDSGEGAQTCGQIFADLIARAGHGIWTVEIIPAEIEPPKRSRAGASGNRIRIGADKVTNAGDCADIVVAFNEQVLYSRIDSGALREGTIVFVDGSWLTSSDERIVEQYREALADFRQRGYVVIPLPIVEECLKHADDVRKGKNIWVLGLLSAIYDLDRAPAHGIITQRFSKKGEATARKNIDLFDAGLTPGEKPRYFIDMLGFIEMARDRRAYRFLQDTRHGRVTLKETDKIDEMLDAVTSYIARRLVEREQALASDQTIEQAARAYAAKQNPEPETVADTAAPTAPATGPATLADVAQPPRKRRPFYTALMFVIEFFGAIALFALLAALGYFLWEAGLHQWALWKQP